MDTSADFIGLGVFKSSPLSTRLEYTHRQLETMLNSGADPQRIGRALLRLEIAFASFVRDARKLEDLVETQRAVQPFPEQPAEQPRRWWSRRAA